MLKLTPMSESWDPVNDGFCRKKPLFLLELLSFSNWKQKMTLSFKWRQSEKDIILMLVRWYCAYSLSYRDIKELAKERGLSVDHSTINRWVIRYAPQLEAQFRRKYKHDVNSSWHMDETYLKIKGKDVYLYRAIDKMGNMVDFMLSKKRDKKAAFFKRP